jgi:hypothetical protein
MFLFVGTATASVARGSVGDGQRLLPLGEKTASSEDRTSISAYLFALES